MQIELVVALVSAVVAIGSLLRSNRLARSQGEKYRSEVMQMVSDTAIGLIAPLKARITVLEATLAEAQITVLSHAARISVLERINKELYNGATRLTQQVIELGEDPVYIPLNTNTTEGE